MWTSTLKKGLFLIGGLFLGGAVHAQYLRTSYFMEGASSRLQLNPGLQPSGGYFNIPVLGSFNIGAIIRKSKFPQNPKRSVRFSGKRTKRSVQKRKARNTQKAETKVL